MLLFRIALHRFQYILFRMPPTYSYIFLHFSVFINFLDVFSLHVFYLSGSLYFCICECGDLIIHVLTFGTYKYRMRLNRFEVDSNLAVVIVIIFSTVSYSVFYGLPRGAYQRSMLVQNIVQRHGARLDFSVIKQMFVNVSFVV